MKVSLRSFLLLLTVAVSYLPVNVSAFGPNSFSQFHPSICEAITVEQASSLIWHEDGLINKNPNMAVWVNCPVPVPTRIGDEILVWFFNLEATNESDQSVELACVLRFSGVGKVAVSKSVIIDPGATGILFWDFLEFKARYLVQCKLPIDVVINAISASTN
jgi:hypothetical protein